MLDQQGAFIHHLSVSHDTGVTAHALGATFMAYVAVSERHRAAMEARTAMNWQRRNGSGALEQH